MKFSTVVALLTLFGAAGAFAQEVTPHVVASAGGQSKVGEVTFMWTVGDIAVTTLQGPSGYITQGFHQPSSETTDAPYEAVTGDDLQLWPNPVSSELFARTGDGVGAIGTVELLDMAGRSVIRTGEEHGTRQVRLDVSGVPSGTYLVRIVSGERKLSRVVTIQR